MTTPHPETETSVANGHVGVFTSDGTFVADFSGSGALVSGVNTANGASGDVVVAGNGSYTGDLNITAAMTVESEHGANNVTTTGDGTNPFVNAAVHIETSNVTIGDDGHGLTINGGASEASAVYIDTSAAGSGHNIVIDGNNINGDAGEPAGNGGAILGGGGEHNVVISDNSITDAPGGSGAAAVYINGESNVNNPSTNIFFTDNHFTDTIGAVLDVSDSVVTGNHFEGDQGFIVLQSPGDIAAHDTGAEISTINGGYVLHGDEVLVTLDDGGSSSNFAGEHKETDVILNWNPSVGIDLADNWIGAPGLTGTATQDGRHDVSIDVSNGGEIDLLANHVTVAQVEHDYGIA